MEELVSAAKEKIIKKYTTDIRKNRGKVSEDKNKASNKSAKGKKETASDTDIEETEQSQKRVNNGEILRKERGKRIVRHQSGVQKRAQRKKALPRKEGKI